LRSLLFLLLLLLQLLLLPLLQELWLIQPSLKLAIFGRKLRDGLSLFLQVRLNPA